MYKNKRKHMNQTKTILLFSIAVMITALAVGGAVYFGQQRILSQKEEEMKQTRQRVLELESQLKEIQTAQQSQKEEGLQIPAIKDWKTYSNEELGFSIMYPDNVFLLDEETKTLYHELKNFHLISEEDGSQGNLAKDIEIVFDQEVEQDCSYFEKNMASEGVEFDLQIIKGIKYDTGAEGRGVVSYCIKDDEDKNIFLIRRFYINDLYSIDLQAQLDYINFNIQDQLFDLMLQTMIIKDYDVAGLKYKNDKYGFSLQFPMSWVGYVAKQSKIDWNEEEQIDSVEFSFGIAKPLLKIFIFTKNQYNNLSESEKLPEFIKQGARYVFTYSIDEEAKDDISKERLSTIKDIVSSLNFE